MKHVPLFTNSLTKIHIPTIDFFNDKIRGDNFFSFIKFTTEWWAVHLISLDLCGISVNDFDYNNDIMLNNMLSKSVEAWKIRRGDSRGHRKINIEIYKDIIKNVLKNNGIIIGTTDKLPVYGHDFSRPEPNLKKNGIDSVRSDILMQSLFKNEKLLVHSSMWRVWAKEDKLKRFIDSCINNKLHIVVVGPRYFKNFGEKIKYDNYTHIEIDSNIAMMNIKETLDTIISTHSSLNKRRVIYLMVGASAAVWLIQQLHDKIHNAHLVDIGRALDVYYYGDDEFVNMGFTKWLKP